MKTIIVLCISMFVLGTAFLANGYELETHANLTEAAARQSVLNSAGVLLNLGLRPPIDNSAQTFPNSNGTAGTLMDLLKDGARFEDNGLRPLSHFYNPLTGSGLFGLTSSPDWALADSGTFTNVLASQDNSYPDARQQLYEAMTNSDNVSRRKKFGLVFQSLGQVVHHLQDMAQPQHVRDDPHLALPLQYLALFCVAFPDLCAAVVGIQNPSNYERFTEQFRGQIFPVAAYAPVYSASDTTTFAVPRQFWTNAGKGIAEYTNRGFVSDGTNFRGLPGVIDTDPHFPSPSGGDASIDIVKGSNLRLILNCPGGSLSPVVQDDDELWFVRTQVMDAYTSVGDLNTRTSTYSIFDSDLQRRGKSKIYALNRYTFCTAHSLLLPRAVGYSAGLINYFFRGNMEISLPDEAVYSIVDHSPTGCGSPCGFRTLKLKLKNVTPGNEAMGAGNLVAVAKYHLNTCYRPDLSGEDGGINFTGNSCRSVEEYISVSAPQPVGAVRSDQPQQIPFDFTANPIPIDASDVFLQVVFRGRLGLETDAVAVATKDISEPTFYGLENMTDYVYDDLGDEQYHPLPYHSSTDKLKVTDIRIAFGPNAATNLTIARLDLLDGGEHAHFALLTDREPQLYSRTWGGPYESSSELFDFHPDAFTLDDTGPAAGIYERSCDVALHRGLYYEYGLTFINFAGGITGWHILGSDARPLTKARLSAPNDAHRIQPQAARDPWCSHPLPIGTWDFSTMTPFSPATAKAWNIQF